MRGIFLIGVLFSSLSWAQNVQKGAEYFLRYCSGCHSLNFSASNLWFDKVKPLPEWQSHFVKGKWHSRLSKQDAIKWFGQQPPDLSLIAHQRGRAWIVAYLTGFYDDEHQNFGRNNLMMKNVGMPDVLYNTGLDRPQIANDIADFLLLAADPKRDIRVYTGSFVMLLCFLGMFIVRHLKKQFTV
jgi:ubiquinol-cytochrome c reductase cytochrome c1 subunit